MQNAAAPALNQTADISEIEDLYKGVIDRLEAVDRWLFAETGAGYPALLAARAQKIAPVMETAHPLAAKAAAAREAGAAHGILSAKIDAVIEVEKRLADFLQNPAREPELEALNKKLIPEGHHASGKRIYRHLIWHKRTFPATPTVQENGIAAVLRVKNEINHMRLMLPALLGYFDEVVVVDHNSADGTYNYVAGLNHPKIRLFRYAVETARAGEFYEKERREGKGSLADYYNYSFAQATAAYLCKWDADMYPLPTLRGLLDSIRKHECDFALFGGLDCYGNTSCNPEQRLFRRTIYRYEDEPHYEVVKFTGDNLRVGRFPQPVYLHMHQDKMLKMGE